MLFEKRNVTIRATVKTNHLRTKTQKQSRASYRSLKSTRVQSGPVVNVELIQTETSHALYSQIYPLISTLPLRNDPRRNFEVMFFFFHFFSCSLLKWGIFIVTRV